MIWRGQLRSTSPVDTDNHHVAVVVDRIIIQPAPRQHRRPEVRPKSTNTVTYRFPDTRSMRCSRFALR
jgi:hypothetical protein